MNFDSCNVKRNFTNIQNFGLLVIIERNSLKIVGFSDNVPKELNFTKENLYELENFSKVIKEDYQEIFYNYLLYKVDKKSTRVILLCNEKEYYCHSYRSNQYIVLELEEKTESITISFDNIFSLINETNIKYEIVNVIKDITKFKRVMLYEFETDYSGLVTIEKSDYQNQQSFLNLHFHESDIPSYVRSLYCKNPIRYIHNIDNTGIEINWKDQQEFESTESNENTENISDKIDASSSEIINTTLSHKRYLRLMDAKSSFSIAILVNHKLWGLVICHNDVPVYLNPSIRQQCCQFVNMISTNIMNNICKMETNFNSYIYELYKFTSIFNFTSTNETENILSIIILQIIKIIKADYIIGNINNTTNCIPFDKTNILHYIMTSNLSKFENNTFCSDNIQEDFKKIFNIYIPPEICKCMIFIKLNKNEWVAFVKKGIATEINWAGKNDVYLENGITFPRKDFSVYKDMKITCKPFNTSIDNINYLQQLLTFFIERMTNVNIFSEYFISHDKSKQSLLFSNITHEIRNPLNAIIGIFDLLKMDSFDKIKEIPTIIDDGIMISNQLLELISNLINTTRYLYNDSLSFTPIIWKNVIENCINTYKYILKPNVQMNYTIDPKLPILVTDTIKVQQILSNLLSNAAKFTEKGTIDINIHLINKIDNIYWVKIKISDTGIGIKKDKQIRLFNTFEQANTDFIHSSGIGLSICLQLATLLSGNISFESEENIGTTFQVNLPLIEKKINSKILSKNKLINIDIPLNILIVEDNYINKKILETKLKDKKHNVISCSDGLEAIEIIKNSNIKFHLILMDLQMNKLDGIQTTAILRGECNFTNTIVAVTGHSFDNSFYTNHGFNDMILKPIDYYKLYNIINEIQSRIK